jgi:hypothetical protein
MRMVEVGEYLPTHFRIPHFSCEAAWRAWWMVTDSLPLPLRFCAKKLPKGPNHAAECTRFSRIKASFQRQHNHIHISLRSRWQFRHDFAIKSFVYRSDSIRAKVIRSSNCTLISLQPHHQLRKRDHHQNRNCAHSAKKVCVSLRTDKVRYFHVIFIPIILFRALSSSNVVEHAGSLAKQIKTENPTIWKLDCTSIRTDLERCWHVIFISVIWFRARGNALERIRPRLKIGISLHRKSTKS